MSSASTCSDFHTNVSPPCGARPPHAGVTTSITNQRRDGRHSGRGLTWPYAIQSLPYASSAPPENVTSSKSSRLGDHSCANPELDDRSLAVLDKNNQPRRHTAPPRLTHVSPQALPHARIPKRAARLFRISDPRHPSPTNFQSRATHQSTMIPHTINFHLLVFPALFRQSHSLPSSVPVQIRSELACHNHSLRKS